MEILRDFSEFENNKKSANEIIMQLENDRKELNKQIHIFKVLDVGSKIQQLFDDGTFKKNDLVSIHIHYEYDYDYGNEIKYSLHKEDGEVSRAFLPDDLIDKIGETFRIIEGFKLENINMEFNKPHTSYQVKTEENFKEKFTDLLLSDELKRVLNYSRLQNDLPKTNSIKDKTKKL